MDILKLNLFLIVIYSSIFLFFFRNKITKKLYVTIVTVQMIVFNGLRHMTVGIDTLRYYRSFQRIVQTHSIKEIVEVNNEIGYEIFQKISSLVTNDFHIFLLITSTVMFVLLGRFIYKYSENYFLSYLLFIVLGFYDFTFTGIKQSLALVIVLISYKYIIDKKLMPFLMMCILAMSFHSSAMVFIPMYFIANISWNRYKLLFLPVAYMLIFIFKNHIGRLLTLVYYEESSYVLEKYAPSGIIGGLSIFILFVIFMGWFIYNPRKYKDRSNVVLFNIMIMALFIQTVSSFSYLFTRLNMFYLVFVILYIPKVMNNIDKLPVNLTSSDIILVKNTIKITLIVTVTIYYLNNISLNTNGIIPFIFYWQ